MTQDETTLIAHLLRRAGFGATRDELKNYVRKGYEATVEEILHPEKAPNFLEEEDVIRRYHVGETSLTLLESCQTYWLYRMINTQRPLEEKIALFWHGIFATGYTKLNHPKSILKQIDMFRRFGLGSFQSLLLELSRDPAMIFWLDNKDSHLGAVNENYGRELLELFSMGVGNYSEDDVKVASRAFTGWTMRNASLHAARTERDSIWPYGRLDWQFQYLSDDHDNSEKIFLGHAGRFNGEDVIDIICHHTATARFIARHIYNFFVADEPQVSAWETVPPRDPEAIRILMDAFVQSEYNIRSVLRVLFNSDFFKASKFARVKSPAEFVVGTVRLTGSHRFPDAKDIDLAIQTDNMGQQLLNPPSVEGWHTGQEWIDTGSLVNRVNYATEQFGDSTQPGVKSIIEGIKANGDPISPESLVDAALNLMGPISVPDSTRRELENHAAMNGELRFGSRDEHFVSDNRIQEMLQLIVATREYQFA